MISRRVIGVFSVRWLSDYNSRLVKVFGVWFRNLSGSNKVSGTSTQLQSPVAKMPVKKDTTALLAKLRDLMANVDLVGAPLTAYLVPSRDAHNSEYLAACDERRAFLSGFDGSAGEALITPTKALMWTDGRYHIQAAEQMDSNWTLMKYGLPDVPTNSQWINQELPRCSRIGVDPRLWTIDEWDRLSNELKSNGNKLVAIDQNLVDLVWENRPLVPSNPVTELSVEFAGKTAAEKLKEVREDLTKQSAEYLVITALDEICWLLNWRGSDIPYNPVFFAYCIVGHSSLDVFIDPAKLSNVIRENLAKEENTVRFHNYEDVRGHLESLVGSSSGKIMLSKHSSYWLGDVVPYDRRIAKLTPIAYLKAIKNLTEVNGMRNCHIRDGAAVCRFFGWLEKALQEKEPVTEQSACQKLESFRKELPNFVGLSFPTIAGSGANGAIIHYNPDSNPEPTPLSVNEVFLVDSGAQYLDGTTDITRTVHFGEPTQFQRECYTRVLKGQIQLVHQIFPKKLAGNYLDSFARKALWEVGLDYLHGTGHGVGHYLNVHEGPSGISWRPYPDDPGLQENMFMSNEPGYYHEGEFGIRLENVIRVVKAETRYKFGDREFLTFEDVTMVPIQQRMIEPNMLSALEILYLNAYHAQCRKKVGTFMQKQGIPESDLGYQWLIRETESVQNTPDLC